MHRVHCQKACGDIIYKLLNIEGKSSCLLKVPYETKTDFSYSLENTLLSLMLRKLEDPLSQPYI